MYDKNKEILDVNVGSTIQKEVYFKRPMECGAHLSQRTCLYGTITLKLNSYKRTKYAYEMTMVFACSHLSIF